MPALRHTCSVMILHVWLMKPSQPLCFVPVEARVGVCGYIVDASGRGKEWEGLRTLSCQASEAQPP